MNNLVYQFSLLAINSQLEPLTASFSFTEAKVHAIIILISVNNYDAVM